MKRHNEHQQTALEWTYCTAILHITCEMAAEMRGFHSRLYYVSAFKWLLLSHTHGEREHFFHSRVINRQEDSRPYVAWTARAEPPKPHN